MSPKHKSTASESTWVFATGLECPLSLCVSVTQLCPTLCDPMDCSPVRPLYPWDSTGVGCHSLFQGIFLTRGSNPGLPHCRQTLLPSEPPGNPLKRKKTPLNTSHLKYPNSSLVLREGLCYLLKDALPRMLIPNTFCVFFFIWCIPINIARNSS